MQFANNTYVVLGVALYDWPTSRRQRFVRPPWLSVIFLQEKKTTKNVTRQLKMICIIVYSFEEQSIRYLEFS